jgi:predicted RNA-binding Zn-ribbon protein involved in translation (DUF1610 family)
MPHQPELIHDQPSPEQAARDAEQAEYLERLREKLKDPDFRATEGFPVGEDEDILALSDPPYYTACPNPFLPEIIERWQGERAQIREELGLPDDSEDNGDSGEPVYHREPFAADVREGKNDPIYRAHSYHTKVPHKAVMRYILHYTDPGDIIFDGFCGTGMTGVAAQLCGDKKTVESLGYRAQDDGTVLDEKGQAISWMGARKALLVDLSPAATFIAYNYNTLVDVTAFEHEGRRILRDVEKECGWMYDTTHSDGKTKGRINYTVWSDVFICPDCGGEMIFWDVGIDRKSGKVKDAFPCPHCDAEQTKRNLERAQEVVYDPSLAQTIRRARQEPVLIHYNVGRRRLTKRPGERDLALIAKIAQERIPYPFPTERIDRDIDMWYERDYRSLGLYSVDGFFTFRNLHVLAVVWHRIQQAPEQSRRQMEFVFTGALQIASRMSSFRYDSRNPTRTAGGILKGALYVPSLSKEGRVTDLLERRLNFIIRMLNARGDLEPGWVAVSTASATAGHLASNSVDYIFTDPPFGSNIIYSDLSMLWETWLGVATNTGEEAVVHRRKKTNPSTLSTYQAIMTRCFEEAFRILRPGRWMTVEFHNTQNAVWNAIQEAVLRAGFVVADVRTLDKGTRTFKQVTATGAVKQDLIISSYKPRAGFERRFLEQAGSTEGAWDFVRQHLDRLPIVVEQDGTLEVVAERQAYLLYDRMVAFHIQRGFSVPMGAAEFYAGLKQRFPERDDMYFLPHQVAEYDRRRLQVSKVEQLALFLTDEKSAIQWLRRELSAATGSGPQTYQDLQPKFLRELHQARHEDLPELSEMLAQNFLKDEQDRWYVPDPARQEDLEKLRERSLLREFQEYAQGKGRLRVFRTEAVRAGFKHAWHERNYQLIVTVAERLPASVLQEDAGLLMYYDNALMRAESQSVQDRLL